MRARASPRPIEPSVQEPTPRADASVPPWIQERAENLSPREERGRDPPRGKFQITDIGPWAVSRELHLVPGKAFMVLSGAIGGRSDWDSSPMLKSAAEPCVDVGTSP